MVEKNNIEKVLINVANEAGEFLRSKAFNFGEVQMKGENDPVTQADKDAELLIREYVKKNLGNSNFIGEELDDEKNIANRYTWIIDPIDGTKSFVKNHFNTSLSIAVNSRIGCIEDNSSFVSHACVYDFMRDIMYVGTPQGKKLLYKGEEQNFEIENPFSKIKRTGKLELLVNSKGNEIGKKLIQRGVPIELYKQNGSIALSMAQVAFGLYDGYLLGPSEKGNYWDLAAGHQLLMLGDDFTVFDVSKKSYVNDGREINTSKGYLAVNKSLKEDVYLIL